MPRILAALTLSASLLLAGCQNPDGSTNWGDTLLLGAGLGVAAGLVAGAVGDQPRQHRYAQDYGRGGYRGGQGGGHAGRGYRGW